MDNLDKPFRGNITNWKINVTIHGDKWIKGTFVHHPSFKGQHGWTSKIVSIKDSDGYWDVETLNSRYRLDYADEHIEKRKAA